MNYKHQFFTFTFVLLSLIISNQVFAQSKGLGIEDFEGDISASDLQKFKTLTKNKVLELQNYISIIGDKSSDNKQINHSIKSAQALFFDDASFEVSSKSSSRIKTYRPVRLYFTALKTLKADKVVITFYDVAYFSDFQRGVDGRYFATAIIFQDFKSYNKEGRLLYHDRTTKQINVSLERQESQFTGNVRWALLLGDVKVTETK